MAGALAHLKQDLKAFKHDRAGERFENHRQRIQKRSKAAKVLGFAAGIILLAAGLVFCVLPGPGLPLILFGLALIAARSKRLSKVFDRVEPALRRGGRAIVRRWRAMPRAAKGSVIAAIVLLAVAGMTFMWHFVVSVYLLD